MKNIIYDPSFLRNMADKGANERNLYGSYALQYFNSARREGKGGDFFYFIFVNYSIYLLVCL